MWGISYALGMVALNPNQFGDDAPLRWTRSAMTVSWSPPEGAPDKDYDDEAKSGYADYCMDCGFPEVARKRQAGLDVHTTYHDNFDHACEGPDCGIDPVKAEREWKREERW